MSEHRSLLRETVDRLFAAIAADTDADPRESWREIELLGLPDLLRPAEPGEFAGDWNDADIVFKASGAHGLPVPANETVLARSWLAALTPHAPQGIGGFALTATPNHGSAGATQIASGPSADWMLVIDRGNWSLVDVAADRCGKSQANPFDPAQVGEDAVIDSGRIAADPAPYFQQAALMRACQIAGALETMVTLSLRHVRDRHQFGRPLAGFQAIQHQMAVALEESAAASCATASACQAVALGDAEFEIAAAKWRVGKAADTLFDIAHQVHGAIGFTQEYPLHRYSLPAQKWRRDFGSESHWARHLARMVLMQRPGKFWEMLTARHDAILAAERSGAPA